MGDAGALHEFVKVYHPPVFALCFRMLRHHQDAEDTTQESLVRALRYLGSWDSSQPLTPWVMKIAANRCRTNLGKRTRRPATSEAVRELASSPAVDHASLAEELQLALNVLAEHQRQCFCLFYERQLSVSEIAEAMDVPEGTVKTWLHRGRKQLAQRLQERGITPSRRTSPPHAAEE